MQPDSINSQRGKQALLLAALGLGWWIAVLLAYFYLRDMIVQALGVGVYLPSTLGSIGLTAWLPLIPAMLSSLAAAVVARFGTGRFGPYVRALTVVSFALLVADAFAILAILFYVSITPT